MWLLRCAHIMSTQWAPLSFLTFVFEARPTLSIIEIPSPKILPLAWLNKAPCSGVTVSEEQGSGKMFAVSCGPHKSASKGGRIDCCAHIAANRWTSRPELSTACVFVSEPDPGPGPGAKLSSLNQMLPLVPLVFTWCFHCRSLEQIRWRRYGVVHCVLLR